MEVKGFDSGISTPGHAKNSNSGFIKRLLPQRVRKTIW